MFEAVTDFLKACHSNAGYIILFYLSIFLAAVFIHDVFIQKKHTIMHNFPLVGHIRYWLETIGPEMRQYIVANDKEEMPFNRSERRWIYSSAKKQNSYFGFGTTELMYEPGYPVIKNAAFPVDEADSHFKSEEPCIIPGLKVLGESRGRKKAWRPLSLINVSAMSYGSLGKNAVSAINQGARDAFAFHNTGEGSISPYHTFGADLVFQIGTAYFGVRDGNGHFDLDRLVELTDTHKNIRAVEIKLSQGAKPGKGGVLPGKKITAEIAAIRGIPRGVDCISPNAHREFKTVAEMVDFIERIAGATGLPVGIKAAVGQIDFYKELAAHIRTKKKGPDFITIDGGEGGTGAAPLTFSDHVSLPFKLGFTRVFQVFMAEKVAEQVTWIGSGKLGFPDRTLVALAMGCDLINIAREAMIAVGCIQAQRCHTGHCPAGVATQNRWLEAGLNIEDKGKRLCNYLVKFRQEILQLTHTAGCEHPSQVMPSHIEISKGMNHYYTLEENLGYRKKKPTVAAVQAAVEAARSLVG